VASSPSLRRAKVGGGIALFDDKSVRFGVAPRESRLNRRRRSVKKHEYRVLLRLLPLWVVVVVVFSVLSIYKVMMMIGKK
tara:strand:+ start:211 stop:450 length:240 start_codon:yes stop_codon:yes gene_type:complete